VSSTDAEFADSSEQPDNRCDIVEDSGFGEEDDGFAAAFADGQTRHLKKAVVDPRVWRSQRSRSSSLWDQVF
jgi:hypothetical protein